jgi:hypothetical protein
LPDKTTTELKSQVKWQCRIAHRPAQDALHGVNFPQVPQPDFRPRPIHETTMSTKLILLALLIGAPPLPNATPLRTPATVTQTALQHPIASSPSALVSSPSAPVGVSSNPLPPNSAPISLVSLSLNTHYAISPTRFPVHQRDGHCQDLVGTAKKLVGDVLGQTVSEVILVLNS